MPRWLPWLVAAVALVFLANSADGLSSHKAMSQYIRDSWSSQPGFPGGPVYAIEQTPDGYLWLGTEKGLVRFDGISFRLLQPSEFPSGRVLGLAVDGQGNLWVRPQGPRLLRYRDGKFRDMLADLKPAETDVTAMRSGKNGEILFSGLVSGTMRYHEGKFSSVVTVARLPKLIISLEEAPDGKIWLGSKDAGLFYVDGSQASAITTSLPDTKINSLLATDRGEVWISTDSGVVHWKGLAKATAPTAVSHALDGIQALAMIRDREGNVWVGTPNGLLRIDPQGKASFDQRDNSSTGSVTSLFEDREGNLWVGTTRGIARLRESAFTTYSASAGLPAEGSGPVYVDAQGNTWTAAAGGLYRISQGRVQRVLNRQLGGDVIYSISGGQDGLWIGRRGGLTHLRVRGGLSSGKTYTKADGLAQNAVYAVYQNRAGTVWAGTLSGGISRFKDSHFKNYTAADGLSSDSIASILETADGTMWFGTPNGLNAFADGRWRIYNSQNGLPPGVVNCLFEDSTGTLWIGTANGLAFLRSGIVHSLRGVPESLREQIFGIGEDKIGSLWIATANHVLRLDRDQLARDYVSDAGSREYGLADGLETTQGVKRQSSVVADSVGRIWFSMYRGLSVVDPRPANFTAAPALVHIEAISADGRAVGMRSEVRIPAPHQRVTLQYAGLSLAIPARVRFKFRLDGFDQAWSEPTAMREATYTNLDSGTYRFRVMACNSEGAWNGSEASFAFEIEPVFWQTWWFRTAGVLILLGLGVGFAHLRMRNLTRQMNFRFEERLRERTRIAQELHDTLLQGFLSASMQLHVANDHLATDSQAKPLVGRVLGLMEQVIEEGRHAVQGLRRSDQDAESLEQGFSRIWQELGVLPGATFRVLMEGEPRALHPAIREETLRIGREALVNAFRHSGADSIEVELEYAGGFFRLLVRDNGRGIDPQVVKAGREGHWGLSGMRERAERIGARLRVLSSASAGTEIEVSVPGQVAFQFPTSSRSRFFRTLIRLAVGKKPIPK